MATQTSYNFTVQVDYPDILIESIQASSIASSLCSLERSGSGSTMSLILWFADSLSSADQTTLAGLISSYVNAPNENLYVQVSITNAINFGQSLLIQYAAQNVLAGITQAGQTASVASYLQQLSFYLNSGSLYAAINEINSLIADTSSTKTSLSPFITNNLLYTYLNKIQKYLNLPLTVNPGS